LIEAKDYEQQRVNRKKNPTKSKHYAIIFKKLTYHAAPIISLTDTVDVNKEVAEEKENASNDSHKFVRSNTRGSHDEPKIGRDCND
jgi:hypothetical protein